MMSKLPFTNPGCRYCTDYAKNLATYQDRCTSVAVIKDLLEKDNTMIGFDAVIGSIGARCSDINGTGTCAHFIPSEKVYAMATRKNSPSPVLMCNHGHTLVVNERLFTFIAGINEEEPVVLSPLVPINPPRDAKIAHPYYICCVDNAVTIPAGGNVRLLEGMSGLTLEKDQFALLFWSAADQLWILSSWTTQES